MGDPCAGWIDLTGVFCTTSGHVDPEEQTGTDRNGPTADRSADGEWEDGAPSLQGSRNSHPDVLSVAGAAERTLDGEDRFGILASKGRGGGEGRLRSITWPKIWPSILLPIHFSYDAMFKDLQTVLDIHAVSNCLRHGRLWRYSCSLHNVLYRMVLFLHGNQIAAILPPKLAKRLVSILVVTPKPGFPF